MAKHYDKLGETLRRLLFERNMKAADLAKAIDMPQPTIHRLVTGKSTRPYRSSLEPIAKYFSVTVDQLIGEAPLLPKQIDSNSQLQKNTLSEIPLINWDDSVKAGPHHNYATDHVVVKHKDDDKRFATNLNDSSMEPMFDKGTTLIIDPDVAPFDRAYILVKPEDSQTPVFRQILVDGDFRYLKPLNPDLSTFQMRVMQDTDTILGTLTEARRNYT